VEALARGTPDAGQIARNIALGKIRELIGFHHELIFAIRELAANLAPRPAWPELAGAKISLSRGTGAGRCVLTS
jgi:hypothetical protein